MDERKYDYDSDDAVFDRVLRARAHAEPISAPIGFEERMEGIMKGLHEQRETEGRRVQGGIPSRRLRRLLTAAAALVIMGTVTVAAAPALLPMAENTIAYFNAPETFKDLSQQTSFEQYNAAVGASTEDQGIRLTVNNIAVSDNYINVFYTVTSEEPISLWGESDSPESWRAAWTAPHFWFKADGTYIDPAAQGETEAYLQDEHTLTGMQRFAVMTTLPDTFNLELYTSDMLDQTGDWHIAAGIDKSAVSVETLTAKPNQKASIQIGDRSHKITVEKVSISPFGNQIVLKERTGNVPFSDFALRDDKGSYLPVISDSLQGNALFSLSNSFEFLNGSLDTKNLTLIPIRAVSDENGGAKEILLSLSEASGAKIALSNQGGFTLNSIEIEDGMIAVSATPYGVSDMNLELRLANQGGEDLGYITHAENRYDRKNGTVTYIGWLDPALTEEDYAKIHGLLYFNEQVELLEDQAITIDLN